MAFLVINGVRVGLSSINCDLKCLELFVDQNILNLFTKPEILFMNTNLETVINYGSLKGANPAGVTASNYEINIVPSQTATASVTWIAFQFPYLARRIYFSSLIYSSSHVGFGIPNQELDTWVNPPDNIAIYIEPPATSNDFRASIAVDGVVNQILAENVDINSFTFVEAYLESKHNADLIIKIIRDGQVKLDNIYNEPAFQNGFASVRYYCYGANNAYCKFRPPLVIVYE